MLYVHVDQEGSSMRYRVHNSKLHVKTKTANSGILNERSAVIKSLIINNLLYD